MREKLIELINDHVCLEGKDFCVEECSACLADHLIANGVTVQKRVPFALGGVVKTHADRIRAMSDEELAKFIREPFCDKRTSEECKVSFCGVCEVCIMDWLQQSAEEDDHAL